MSEVDIDTAVRGEIIVAPKERAIDLFMSRDPLLTVQDAEKAASTLAKSVFSKIKPPIINGKQYPTVEHWQTVASFYGVIPRVVSTTFVTFGDVKGFEAVAEAVTGDGRIVSRAEAMCLNDEPRWKGKPLHQVKAMSQTRAISRVLRNVFSRIMVLAGCEATPAEDADGTWDNGKAEVHGAPQDQERKAESASKPAGASAVISEAQRKRMYAIGKNIGWTDQEMKDLVKRYGFDHSADVTRDKYEAICKELESGGSH